MPRGTRLPDAGDVISGAGPSYDDVPHGAGIVMRRPARWMRGMIEPIQEFPSAGTRVIPVGAEDVSGGELWPELDHPEQPAASSAAASGITSTDRVIRDTTRRPEPEFPMVGRWAH